VHFGGVTSSGSKHTGVILDFVVGFAKRAQYTRLTCGRKHWLEFIGDFHGALNRLRLIGVRLNTLTTITRREQFTATGGTRRTTKGLPA
jgi:hypothetical protein